MNLHRVEVEHELRTTLLRLRHHLLLSPDNEDELRAVLAKSITSVLTLFRHALIAVGREAAACEAAVAGKCRARFLDLKGSRCESILELRNGRPAPGKFARTVPCVHERDSAGGSRTGCAGAQASFAGSTLGEIALYTISKIGGERLP